MFRLNKSLSKLKSISKKTKSNEDSNEKQVIKKLKLKTKKINKSNVSLDNFINK
jgi:hypothetical protein